jgi:hypothetical protein
MMPVVGLLVSPHFAPQPRQSGTVAACMYQRSPVPAQHPCTGIAALRPGGVCGSLPGEALRGENEPVECDKSNKRRRALKKLLDNGAWGWPQASEVSSGRKRSSQPVHCKQRQLAGEDGRCDAAAGKSNVRRSCSWSCAAALHRPPKYGNIWDMVVLRVASMSGALCWSSRLHSHNQQGRVISDRR